ncbi:MAG: ATP-binding protein [Candidatus Omnitrophica bacterium]|nr:ATP-binding protein [Candidatus Omnitrophota bacterium]
MVDKPNDTCIEAELLVKSFLQETLREIMALFKVECGSLFLFDSKTKELVLESFYNAHQIPVKGIKFQIGEGVTGKVIADKTPVLVKDIDRDIRFHKNGFKHYQTKSFISVPLASPDGVLGVINLADKASGEPFTEQDLDFATSLVQYAGVIAYNICLAEKLKREKEALDKQKSMLEKYASVGKLAAGVVHEINNPLDGIIRFTNMLLNQVDNNSVTREYLLEIKKGLNRIENTTKSLLQFSHQVNQISARVKTYVDVQTCVEDSLSVFAERMRGNVDIITNFSPRKIKMLDIGIAHVFINIIKNALDAMPGGGKLSITSDLKDSYVEVIFKDSGVGIPPEIRTKIFEAFFTTKNADQGTGLGLSICREIINRYEGGIEVESLCGEGSTFRVIIPKKFIEHV